MPMMQSFKPRMLPLWPVSMLPLWRGLRTTSLVLACLCALNLSTLNAIPISIYDYEGGAANPAGAYVPSLVPIIQRGWGAGKAVASLPSLGIARFLPELQANAAAEGAQSAAGTRGENFGTRLPRLILEKLLPLPGHKGTGAIVERPISLWPANADGRFVELSLFERVDGAQAADAKPAPAAATTAPASAATTKPAPSAMADYILVGRYTPQGAMMLVTLHGFAPGDVEPSYVWSGSSSPEDVRAMVDELMPSLLAWLAGRPLYWVELHLDPADATVAIGSYTSTGRTSRLYFEKKGIYPVIISKNGYVPITSSIELGPDPSREFTAKLESAHSIATGAPAAPSGAPMPGPGLADTAALQWKGKDNFPKERDAFTTALTMLAVSVPVTLLTVGNFSMYAEAYSRDPSLQPEYIVSATAMGLSITATVGFIIYAGIRIARYLNSVY